MEKLILSDLQSVSAGMPYSIEDITPTDFDQMSKAFRLNLRGSEFMVVVRFNTPLHVASVVVDQANDIFSYALTPWGAIRLAIMKHFNGGEG